jgi:hypothetical protein
LKRKFYELANKKPLGKAERSKKAIKEELNAKY